MADMLAYPRESVQPPEQAGGGLERVNGKEWTALASHLTKPSSVEALSELANLPQPIVVATLGAFGSKIREASFKGPHGETLYVRTDAGLKPRLWELLHVFQLAAR